MPFKKGVSGNSKGRPPGSLGQTTIWVYQEVIARGFDPIQKYKEQWDILECSNSTDKQINMAFAKLDRLERLLPHIGNKPTVNSFDESAILIEQSRINSSKAKDILEDIIKKTSPSE